MFGFLKDKLKNAISSFSKKAEEGGEEKEAKREEEPKAEELKTEKVLVEEEKKEILEREKKVLEEEKKIIEEEKKLEEPLKEEVTEVEEEVHEAVKEEEEKKLEQERIELEKEVEEIEKLKEKKSFFGFLKRKKEEKEPKAEEKKEEAPVPEKKPVEDEKKGILKKVAEGITTKKIDENKFEELFWDLELALLENNVAVEVIEKIKDDLKENLVNKPLTRTKISEIIGDTLKSSIKEILESDNIDLIEKVKTKKPYVICFVGINGSGKTTTIAKMAELFKQNDLKCIMAASDTFRAAAIDQLQYHADKLNVKLIKQDYGADPAAVAFDAIKHAEAKNIDVVLIDTAGRMHSNVNLTDEMKKIVRVAKPDLKIFVGESITGNDCIEQAKQFNDAIDIDGIILSKADVDEKGGAALSVSYITKKPILYIGTGQDYKDIKKFSPEIVLDNLGL